MRRFCSATCVRSSWISDSRLLMRAESSARAGSVDIARAHTVAASTFAKPASACNIRRMTRAACRTFIVAACLSIAAACAVQPTAPAAGPAATATAPKRAPYASTYLAGSAPAILIRNATVLTGTGTRIDGGDVLIVDGRIVSVGKGLEAPGDAQVIDAARRWLTPGLIDVHSHMGVYPSPGVDAHSDGNESTDPVTANVWAEHSLWPQDPAFEAALQGGVTSLQLLPGSANLIGGRGVTIKNVPATTYQAMKFPGAKQGLKMACGENPKRVYGRREKAPSTRMANVAGYRQAFADARDYQEQWKEYEAKRAVYEKKQKDKKDEDEAPPK